MKYCKKFLIADALLNYSKNSITKFIEDSEDSELMKLAETKGIVMPSPDLLLFKTIYAKLGEPNRNGVIINREPVEKSLKTLIAKQINLEHEGKNFICGHIIDAKIEDDYIVIYGAFYKSIFQEEYQTLKNLFKDKKVYVSFEIWSKDPDTGYSVIHDLENGFREINPIIFHGCGLLMEHQPACKEAILEKIIGQKLLENAEQIVNKIFDENLICASLAIEEPKCKGCNPCTCGKEKEEDKVSELYELTVEEASLEIKEEEVNDFENEYEITEIEEAKRLTYEQKKNLPDSDYAVVITVKNKVTGEPRKIRMFVINDEAHVRNALARLGQDKVKETLKRLGVSVDEVEKKILKRAKELNMTELLKRYEKSDARVCPECQQPMNDEDVEVCAVCKKKKEVKASEETKTEEPLAETKTEETPKVEAETKVEEPKVEEKTEEKPEVAETENKETPVEETKEVAQPENPIAKKVVTVIHEEIVTTTDTMDGKLTKVGMRKTIRKFEDGTEEVFTENYEVVDTYTQAQLEEKINALTVEKDVAIESLKTAKEQEIAELKTAIENLDKEIKNLKDELGKKDQEIAKLQPKDEEPKEEKTIDVGEVKEKGDSEIKRQARKINEIIASNKDKGKNVKSLR